MISWLSTTRAKIMLAVILGIALLVTWPLRAAWPPSPASASAPPG